MTLERMTKQFAWYMENGKEYPWRPLPLNIEQGRPCHCFHNSARLAKRRKTLIYVEGLALLDSCIDSRRHWAKELSRPDIDKFARLIVHAWCIDREGYVVDCTWLDGGPRHNKPLYIGVPIPTPE